ncbi:MAG: cardiolipin synthase B [Deltaproteobacteria bacterium]|nr:cardiolipin synthase B [Deltaproteobacteria bacterium]
MDADPASVPSSPVPPPTLAKVEPRYVVEPRAFVPSNEVRFLRDGDQAYPAMLAAIEGAKRFVHLESYIFADDGTGHRFARALAHAAERGVEVTVLYDAVGSWTTHRGFFKAMRRRGVRARAFNPVWPWPGLLRTFRRDHRKLLVVDGEVAFVGGINISDDWAPRIDGGQDWRDDVMRLEGPVVAGLDGVFRATWRAVVQNVAERLQLRAPVTPSEPCGPRGTHAVATFAARKAIHKAYVHAIDAAERSVFIASSYFVPDRAILHALRRARRRGVEVRLMLPGVSDHYSVLMAGRALYGRLLRWGVRVHEWQNRIFHAKTAVIDGCWGTMGSFNLDRWSLHFSHELNAVFSDPELGRTLEDSFRNDLDGCLEVTLELWKARPRWRRLMEWFFGRFDRWL